MLKESLGVFNWVRTYDRLITSQKRLWIFYREWPVILRSWYWSDTNSLTSRWRCFFVCSWFWQMMNTIVMMQTKFLSKLDDIEKCVRAMNVKVCDLESRVTQAELATTELQQSVSFVCLHFKTTQSCPGCCCWAQWRNWSIKKRKQKQWSERI